MRNDVETDVAISLLESKAFDLDRRGERLEKQVLAAAVMCDATREMVEKLRREVAAETTAPVTGVLSLTRADVEDLDFILASNLRGSAASLPDSRVRSLHQKVLEALK